MNMQLAAYIDHTYLRPDCREPVIDQLMAEATEYGFKAICIPPMYLGYAVEKSSERSYLLCTVAGFPIGYDHMDAKLASLKKSALQGADEIDVVINLANIKTAHWEETREEIRALRDAAQDTGTVLKCIIEAQLLTDEEIMRVCDISNEIAIPFVKTSTGFFGEPVREETVRLLRRHLDPAIQIKASGGIAHYHQALNMIRAGADRLGCSQSVQIINESNPG